MKISDFTELPESIRMFTEGKAFLEDNIGLSDSKVYIFEDFVLKICKAQEQDEAEILRRLEGGLPVPKLLCHEVRGKNSFLLMSRIKGRMACDEYYMERPELLCRLLAESLHSIWEADISVFPNAMSIDEELDLLVKRFDKVDSETKKSIEWLKSNKPQEELVLSHGDFCLPNVIFDGEELSGFIDMANCAVRDRWSDIADCFRSLINNYGGVYGGRVYEGFHPEMFFDALGIEADRKKLLYYAKLDELYSKI